MNDNIISFFTLIATSLIVYKAKDEIKRIVPANRSEIRIGNNTYQPDKPGNINPYNS